MKGAAKKRRGPDARTGLISGYEETPKAAQIPAEGAL
jgi:hypothetical protein